jgi:antitoxin FitA
MLMLIVEPAFVAFFVVIIKQVGLQQLVHQDRHVREDLLADRRSPDAQRKLLSGLLVGDILRCPGTQLTSGLLRGLRGRVLVLVRNLDDRVIESLRAKAELKGCSLEQELREVLTNAAPLTPEEKIALFRKLRAMTPPLEDVDVRAAIRRGRDDEFDG